MAPMPLQVVSGVRRYALQGGGVALLHPDRRRLFVYNQTAHLLWRALGRGDRSCLPFVLASRFGLPLDTAEQDVDAILAEWIANGLLTELARPSEASPRASMPRQTTEFDEPLTSSRFRIGDLVVDVRASAMIESSIMPLWGHLRNDALSADVHYLLQVGNDGLGRLTIDGSTRVDGVEPHVLIGTFYQTILEHLHPATRWCAMFHAGAVAREGRAIIVAAPSGFGKSTLIAYLVARGFEYLSDDLASLRAQDHAVAAFPLPISVKSGAAQALAPFYPSLDAGACKTQFLIQDSSFRAPVRPAKAVIFPRYVAGARTRFEEVSVQDALTRLLNDRISFGYPIEDEILTGFIRWLRGIERRALIYSEFAEAERCMTQIVKA